MSRIYSSAPDLFQAPEVSAILGTARIGKVRSYPRLRDGERTAAFILAGQSLAAGSAEGLYTPVNADKIDNLNMLNGEMLKAADPLIGGGLATNPLTQATSFTRVADQLVTSGDFDRVILVPVAIGGTSISDWAETHFARIINGYRRANALGLPITAILWQQGETGSGTVTQSQYVTGFNTMRSKVVADGCTAPWIVAKSTYIPGGAIGAGTRAAIDALVNGIDILMGPDCDTLGAAYRHDDQHWNATGNAAASALWTSAIQAAL